MAIPQYADEGVYKYMVKLCELAGVPVQYTNIDNEIYARTREFGEIQMPMDDCFDSDEHATMVLGHELGHHLLKMFYVDTEFINPDTDKPLNTMIESQCDFVGVVLYKLAEMIAKKPY